MIRPIDWHERAKAAGHQDEDQAQRELVEKLQRRAGGGHATRRERRKKAGAGQLSISPDQEELERAADDAAVTPADEEQPQPSVGRSLDVTA